MWLRMGNPAPAEEWTNPGTGEKTRREVPLPDESDEQVTEVMFPPDHDLIEAFTNVVHPGGVWAAHADDVPSWVMSDVPELATLVAANFRRDGKSVEVREPGAGDEPIALVGPAHAEGGDPTAPGVEATTDGDGVVHLSQAGG